MQLQTDESPTTPRRRAPRHFRAGRFGYLWGASAASSVGDGLALVAFPLLATRLTHSPLLIAGVAASTRLPWLLFSLPLGALADRVNRRRLLMVVELSRMGILIGLGALITTGHASIEAIYATAFALGVFQILFLGATQALIPQLVSRDRLTSANGRLYAIQMAGEQFLGPALGGIAFAAMASLPFLADGLSFAASAALLVLALPHRAQWSKQTTGRGRFSADIRDGVRWFAQHRILRLTAALISAFAFCQSMGLAILVVFGLRVLHLSGPAFGLFMAGGSVGNLVGALLAAHIARAVGTGRVLVAAGIAAGVAFLAIGSTSALPVTLAALILEALAVGVGNVAFATLCQTMIPTELAGRVNVVMRSCIYGALTLGALTGGVLATSAGSHAPFSTGGVLQIAATLAIGLPLARRLAVDAATEIDVDTIDLDVDPWISNGAQVEEPAFAASEVA